jgi:hypothetical protein
MAFWIREIIGWLLVLAGGNFLLSALSLANDGRVIEAGIHAVVGVVVFRGGIHLLKVSTAARIVQQANRARQATSAGPTRPTSSDAADRRA